MPKEKKSVKSKKNKMCGGDCIAPTICKDAFNGECALEMMQNEKSESPMKPGYVTGRKSK